MKHLREIFTEEEWLILKEAKGDRTWREFLLNVSTVINAQKILEHAKEVKTE